VSLKIEALDKAEINRLGRLMVLSFTAFWLQGGFCPRLCHDVVPVGRYDEVIFEMALQADDLFPLAVCARAAIFRRTSDLVVAGDVYHARIVNLAN